MALGSSGRPVAILAGGGALPPLVAAASEDQGRLPIVFAIEGEAAPADFAAGRVHVIRWGQIGRLFKLIAEAACDEAVFIGSISRRPDFTAMRPDLGAMKFIPRVLQLMRGGDDSLLAGVAAIFQAEGIRLVGPLDIAPGLALPAGPQAGAAGEDARIDIAKAYQAAREIGRLDIGQAAVAMRGRVVAVEDAGGTDALLHRVAELRREGRIAKAGGVLVKCMKPQQDARLDVPTIGPATAEAARLAGLSGVAAEAARTLLAGREATLAAFERAGLFLLGLTAAQTPADE
jgi:DUF1009 family protein